MNDEQKWNLIIFVNHLAFLFLFLKTLSSEILFGNECDLLQKESRFSLTLKFNLNVIFVMKNFYWFWNDKRVFRGDFVRFAKLLDMSSNELRLWNTLSCKSLLLLIDFILIELTPIRTIDSYCMFFRQLNQKL